jgi:L-fuconolactonase
MSTLGPNTRAPGDARATMSAPVSRHIPVRPDWLALRSEAALDPDRPIIDAHHHLWTRPANPYGLDEFRRDAASGHRIVASIFAECHAEYSDDPDPALRSLGETAYATGIARAAEATAGPRVAAGIIGNVDLRVGARAGEILDRHTAISDGRFKGLRNTSAWHPDPEARGSDITPPVGLLADPDFRTGFAALAPRGLVFDAWMYHDQLDELVALARAFPDTAIVMNHVGGPNGIGPYAGRRDEVFADWRAGMARLAACPNVAVKLGGLGMRLAGFRFHEQDRPPGSEDLAAAWKPYVAACIDLFGPERAMFESNFPVDKGTASYGIVWNAFKRMVADASEADRHALFFGTAVRIYRLDAVAADALAG